MAGGGGAHRPASVERLVLSKPTARIPSFDSRSGHPLVNGDSEVKEDPCAELRVDAPHAETPVAPAAAITPAELAIAGCPELMGAILAWAVELAG